MPDGSIIQERDINAIPSTRRNPVLADIFSRLGYMERQGSGLNKIREAYKNAANYQEGMEPVFYSDRMVFMVILKNLNYKNSAAEAKNEAKSEAKIEAENYVLNSVEEKIFELLKKDSKITQPEIQKQLNLSRSKVQRTMKKLSENGIIEHVGSRRKGHWKVNI